MADEQRKKPRGDLQYRFQKGRPPGPGRPKGSIDKNTLAIRNFCQSLMGGLFKDPKYRAALKDRIIRGKEHPAIIQTLLAYGYGKPKEHIIVENPDGNASEGASRRDELIERLCNRLAPVIITGASSAPLPHTQHGGTGGPILELEAVRETESTNPSG